MNSTLKKTVASFGIALALLVSTANCFGKFSLVRKVYGFHDSIKVGGGFVTKFVKTLIMYLFWIIPVYGISIFIDVILLNLIEFWTDSNPLGLNEYNKEGIYTKTFPTEEGKIQLTYMNFGSQLKINIDTAKNKDEFIVLKSEPGKIFKEINGKLQEVVLTESKVSDKSILKMAIDGKLKSSKVIETKDIQTLETNYLLSL